jgi:CheY-like chemotaxis protein/two-component sensor histidine kinase
MHEREEASRAKDEFLAMLGHELRNPLAPIVTSLELIKRRGGAPLDREHSVIERQVSHLRRLVDDLLDVSRIASGKVQLTKEALQIKSVIFRAIEEASPLLEQRRHQLVVDLPKEGAWVFGDATRLTQVFANLLTNAAKYTDLDGKIWVTVRIEEGSVTTHVKDNGFGISEELLPRLFTIFEQGRTSIDRSAGGLGIGLALVKTFVALHGGTVSATSPGQGLGSDFLVSLPLSDAVHQPDTASVAPFQRLIPGANGVRVLLVDDNADLLQSMEVLLKESGFLVAAAPGAIEALRIVESFKPTVVVLDIGLPVMDGYELANELRLRLPSLQPRLIALSGYGQESDRRRSQAAGIERHLVKPVQFADLVSALLKPQS